ncbi:MAG: hypothetical protein CVV37_02185 [Nitrospira bacterium HGW-Nitrospira-1]|nr:MAG: hypothetical protein CVV37_02185 [Nitrospira bacterium HGW-Nitrospira-1]
MHIPDIIKKCLRVKDSGLLSIKIEGDSHLLKIYLDNGEVVALSLGLCKNEDCLKKLNGAVALDHSFLKGVKSPMPANVPLTPKLIELIGGSSDAGLMAEAIPSSPGVNIRPQIIASLEEEFIGLIGPIGKMLVDNIFSKISYSRGNSMQAEDYSYLLESIKKELPDQEQVSFIARHGKE